MYRGYIKTFRALKDWVLYKEPGAVLLLTHLLISATHKPIKICFEGKPFELQPGQLTAGRKQLSFETGLSEQQIRTLLRKFENIKEINQQSTNKCTLITLIKWEQFQCCENNQPALQPTINQQSTNNQPLNNNHNHDNNIKKEDKSAPTGTQPRKTFTKPTVEEIKSYCLEKNMPDHSERFFDYQESKGWKIGNVPMKDWQAAVRNWNRNNFKTGEKTNANTTQDDDRRIIRRMPF